MNILVVLAHPSPKSFNHAVADTVVSTARENGHTATLLDLYRHGFDSHLPEREIPTKGDVSPEVEEMCRELANADGIVIVHPNWWGQPPAILKGWVDRVFRPGIAYRFLEGDDGGGVPEGLLTAQAALVFNTSNTQEKRERSMFGDPLELIWKNCIFDLCGVDTFYRRMFSVVVDSTEEERKRWLDEVRDTVRAYFPPDG
ncbi:MAG: NAD(P)H-dependent oxidoreductase [Deltaproteobacteria bacterium]|nr:NAD(P)H-dependent oxidoreductase [Candidatus Zymogenaceae bacterium]